MQFPTLVYRCPGDHQRPGGTYSYRPVLDEEQHDAALADGWFDTLPEAIEGKAPVVVEPPADDIPVDTPPTRAELEQKAAELGLTFDKRLGDKKLAALIDAKLKA